MWNWETRKLGYNSISREIWTKKLHYSGGKRISNGGGVESIDRRKIGRPGLNKLGCFNLYFNKS